MPACLVDGRGWFLCKTERQAAKTDPEQCRSTFLGARFFRHTHPVTRLLRKGLHRTRILDPVSFRDPASSRFARRQKTVIRMNGLGKTDEPIRRMSFKFNWSSFTDQFYKHTTASVEDHLNQGPLPPNVCSYMQVTDLYFGKDVCCLLDTWYGVFISPLCSLQSWSCLRSAS